jgi:hypothetical protein
MIEKTCIFTDYLKYRAELRGFDLGLIEHIVRYSPERYISLFQRSALNTTDDALASS